MTLFLVSSLLLSGQMRVGNTENFRGFVPDSQTALEVARPILTRVMGKSYIADYGELYATKIEGRWLVRGKGPREDTGKIIEPYFIALDPWSGRVALFGVVGVTSFRRLKTIPLDNPHLKKRSKANPRNASGR